MLISIIVPIYNVERYLPTCVESLVNQTYQNIEIVLVDDGSPDNCPALCDEYAQIDNRVRVIHKANGGLSDARNAGLVEASGEYILFVDSDDYIESDTCERFAERITDGVDILIGDAIVEGGKCNLKHIEPSETVVYTGVDYLKHAMQECKAPMAVWLNVYRREFLLEHSLYFKKGILHEDEQFTPRVLMSARSVVVTGIVFYHYVIRDNSIMSRKDKRQNAENMLSTMYEFDELLRSNPDTRLRKLIQDSLVAKYLKLYQTGNLKRFGKEYLPKRLLLRNSHRIDTKLKVLLVCISPRLYSFLYSIKA